MKVAEAKDKAQTIDAILFDVAVTAVCGEASFNMKPDQQQVHAVVLSLYRHCLKMSSDETTAEEAFGTLTSLPWLGLSGCRWAEVESIMNLRSRKISMVLNECMATLDVCATSYTKFVKYLLAPTLTLLSELQPEVASVESQKRAGQIGSCSGRTSCSLGLRVRWRHHATSRWQRGPLSSPSA